LIGEAAEEAENIMNATIIDGRHVSAQLIDQTREIVSDLVRTGHTPLCRAESLRMA
jgi:hypothetical protein